MDLYPAIDLCGGRAVRLLRGDYNKMTIFSETPFEVASAFKKAGADYLHLVDLDGAKRGDTLNYEVIRKIISDSGLGVEVGGGIRNMGTVEHYLSLGAMRVIIGTSAVTDPVFLQDAIDRFGEKIAVAVDIKDGMVATHGWVNTSSEDGFDFCKKLQDMGVKTIICTDILKDGAMQGINKELYEQLTQRFNMDIIASGGVTSMHDLESLLATGVHGAILGKSIYTGSIILSEAVETMKRVKKK